MAANLTTSTPLSNCTIDPLIEVDKCLYGRVLERSPVDNYVFILYLPIMVPILVLGLVGNTLAYVVMSKEMRQSSSTICLKTLALADNLVLVTYCMYFTMPMFYKYLGVAKWAMTAREMARPYLWATIWFAKTLSVYIIVQMTIERYLAICKPLSARRFCTERATRLGIVAIIAIDLMYNIPKVYQFEITFKCDPCSGDYLPVAKFVGNRDKYYNIIYVNALYFIIMFVFPLTILFVLNWFLINSIRIATRMRESMSTNVPTSNDNATEKIVGVVIAFLILETPAVILNTLYIVQYMEDQTDDQIGVKSGINYQVILILLQSLYVMSTVNSCINFYIYCLVGRRFRRVLIRTLTSCCSKKRSSPESSMTRSTNGGATNLELQHK